MARLPTHRSRTGAHSHPPRLLLDILREMSNDPEHILSAYRHLLNGPRRGKKEKGGER